MANTVTIEWKDAAWRAAALPSLNLGASAAAIVMCNQARENITLAQSPPTSRPGELPHRDTGNLSEHLAVVSPTDLGTPLHAAFGTSVWYGRTLEFGGFRTVHRGGEESAHHAMDFGREPGSFEVFVAARPWIVRSAMMAQIPAYTAFWGITKDHLKTRGLSH